MYIDVWFVILIVYKMLVYILGVDGKNLYSILILIFILIK